jgi:hypothetical protein
LKFFRGHRTGRRLSPTDDQRPGSTGSTTGPGSIPLRASCASSSMERWGRRGAAAAQVSQLQGGFPARRCFFPGEEDLWALTTPCPAEARTPKPGAGNRSRPTPRRFPRGSLRPRLPFDRSERWRVGSAHAATGRSHPFPREAAESNRYGAKRMRFTFRPLRHESESAAGRADRLTSCSLTARGATKQQRVRDFILFSQRND